MVHTLMRGLPARNRYASAYAVGRRRLVGARATRMGVKRVVSASWVDGHQVGEGREIGVRRRRPSRRPSRSVRRRRSPPRRPGSRGRRRMSPTVAARRRPPAPRGRCAAWAGERQPLRGQNRCVVQGSPDAATTSSPSAQPCAEPLGVRIRVVGQTPHPSPPARRPWRPGCRTVCRRPRPAACRRRAHRAAAAPPPPLRSSRKRPAGCRQRSTCRP